MEKKISGYVQKLFQDELSWTKKNPWKKLTHADFENWPRQVPVRNPRIIPFDQRKILESILEKIKLSEHFKSTYKKRFGSKVSEYESSISRI